MRLSVVAVAFVVLAGGCAVDVKDRFRSEPTVSVATTEAPDETTEVDGEETTTETTLAISLRAVPVPAQAVLDAPERISVLGRPVDMVATLAWEQTWVEDRFELAFEADARLELTLLRVNELVRLGIIEEDDPVDPLVRWYSVVGTVRHDLVDSSCVAGVATADCEITFVTDGAVNGLASRSEDIVNIALRWDTLGRGDAEAVPAIGIQYRGVNGFIVSEERNVLRVSLERTRFINGPGTVVGVGPEGSVSLRAGDATGRLEVVDVD